MRGSAPYGAHCQPDANTCAPTHTTATRSRRTTPAVAFLTIQKAYDIIASRSIWDGYRSTITLGAATFIPRPDGRSGMARRRRDAFGRHQGSRPMSPSARRTGRVARCVLRRNRLVTDAATQKWRREHCRQSQRWKHQYRGAWSPAIQRLRRGLRVKKHATLPTESTLPVPEGSIVTQFRGATRAAIDHGSGYTDTTPSSSSARRHVDARVNRHRHVHRRRQSPTTFAAPRIDL